MSDRNAKADFESVDPQKILKKVAAMPVSKWRYHGEDSSIRHMGPTAQDFRAAFGLGDEDTSITAVDADGVALAAIQGLNHKMEEQRLELQDKQRVIENLSPVVLEKLEMLLNHKPEGGAK